MVIYKRNLKENITCPRLLVESVTWEYLIEFLIIPYLVLYNWRPMKPITRNVARTHLGRGG
jgi:hypothetical protein